MANVMDNAYGLTALCPIVNGFEAGRAYGDCVRDELLLIPTGAASPFASVPQLYMCRFYVLDDVYDQGYPANQEHLQSRYLVFCANLHGDLDAFLRSMWRAAEPTVLRLFKRCVAFGDVRDEGAFAAYMARCQVNNALFFNGSNGEPREEQLKALYLKQELTRFAFEHYGKPAAEVQRLFGEFVTRTRPRDVNGPTWQAGKES